MLYHFCLLGIIPSTGFQKKIDGYLPDFEIYNEPRYAPKTGQMVRLENLTTIHIEEWGVP
jgi:hypothetical protein